MTTPFTLLFPDGYRSDIPYHPLELGQVESDLFECGGQLYAIAEEQLLENGQTMLHLVEVQR